MRKGDAKEYMPEFDSVYIAQIPADSMGVISFRNNLKHILLLKPCLKAEKN